MRLFIAVEVDEGLRDKLVGVQTKLLEPSVKLVERENLHITLKFLGEIADSQLAAIRGALKNVKMEPFEIEIGGLGTFPPGGKRINVVWVGCKGPLAELANKVAETLSPLGFRSEREFSSHLTLARVKQKPERLRETVEEMKNIKIGKQLVDRFALNRSTLTQKGPIYETVETYMLSK